MSEYEVGYGRPPRQFHFKKGQPSANPLGRPKKIVEAKENAVRAALNEPLFYYEKGKRKSATNLEVRIKQLIKRAIKGDVKAADMVLDIRAYFAKNGDVKPLYVYVSENETNL